MASSGRTCLWFGPPPGETALVHRLAPESMVLTH